MNDGLGRNFLVHFVGIGANSRYLEVHSALRRLMPNGGSKARKRRLYGHFIESIILYAAPVWTGARDAASNQRKQVRTEDSGPKDVQRIPHCLGERRSRDRQHSLDRHGGEGQRGQTRERGEYVEEKEKGEDLDGDHADQVPTCASRQAGSTGKPATS